MIFSIFSHACWPSVCLLRKNVYSGLLACESINCSVTSYSFAIPWTIDHQIPLSIGFPRQDYWSRKGFPFLLWRIFPTQESNPGLLHCSQILYHLSYQGSPFTGNVANFNQYNDLVMTSRRNKTRPFSSTRKVLCYRIS